MKFFIYETFFALHPKRVKMKNSFFAISHLYAKKVICLSFIFYTKQFVFKVLEKSFHCFSFACCFFSRAIALCHLQFSLHFCIYTNVAFFRFNVQLCQLFKFVVSAELKNPQSFINTRRKQKFKSTRKIPCTMHEKTFLPMKKMRRKREAEK